MKSTEAAWQVIINPAAGNVNSSLTNRIERMLSVHLKNAALHWTTAEGDAIRIARDCSEKGLDHFIVVGGDGTLNEVVNGIYENGLPDKRPVIAVIPAGSGNDWARSLGFNKDLDSLVKRLETGKFGTANIARMEYMGEEGMTSRYFVNVAGLAFDAAVAKKIHGKRYLLPRWLYLYEALKGLFSYRAEEMKIESDGSSYTGKGFTVNVGVQPFSGGGMQLVPHARDAGKKMALTILEPRPGWQLLPQVIRLYTGTLDKLDYAHLSFASTVRISHFHRKVPLEADGEFLGYTPVNFEVIPDALLVPAIS